LEKIKGLNIGGWLVLEKWMTPELYQDTDAEDEYHLLLARHEDKHRWLKYHRDTFITKMDFKWISEHGIDTVRLPLGHWTFKAEEPYISAKKYVDMAFLWAEEYDLKVVLDVHAAPGCQNGFDNGGLSGICEWHKDPIHIEKTIDFIEQLCLHYKEEPTLSGIQVLNEPRWDIPLDVLIEFYTKSYDVIRKYCTDDVYVMFHDAFRLTVWEDFFATNDFTNVILDTHMYQVFSPADKTRSINQLLQKVTTQRTQELHALDGIVDVVVGEWSHGIHPCTLEEATTTYTKNALYRAVGNSLLLTYEHVRGWFFWSYKLSEESTRSHRGWSYKDSVERGDLPLLMKE